VKAGSKHVPLAPGSDPAQAVPGRLWDAHAGDGSVSIVDPREGKVVEHIPSVCSFPLAMSEDRHNRVWLACFASAELVAIDASTFEILKRFRLNHPPLNLLVHPTRDLAYVSLTRQNAVAEIDLASGREIRRITVGIEPDGLVWAPREQ
jgi:streptogramin lyase